MSKKTAPKKRQRAQLRVVRRTAAGVAQVMYVAVRGLEIATGSDAHESASRMRCTYHESGQFNLHTALDAGISTGRTDMQSRTPPASVRGAELVWQTSTTAQKWSYAVKPDSEKKKTLVLDEVDYPEGACVQLWAVEPQRLDVLDELRTGRTFGPRSGIEVGAHLTCGWTLPVLVILALRMTAKTVASFRRSVEADGGDPTEPIDGFVLGPNPNGLKWEVLGSVAPDGSVSVNGA